MVALFLIDLVFSKQNSMALHGVILTGICARRVYTLRVPLRKRPHSRQTCAINSFVNMNTVNYIVC